MGADSRDWDDAPITARKLGDDFDRTAVLAALEQNAHRSIPQTVSISVGTSVSGTYKVDTEADPATVTIVPEIAIAGFKAGTEITFTASYNKDNKVLTLNNDSWGTLNLTEVEA